MKRGSFLMGFLTCLLLAGVTTTAYAAGIMAERSQHRILVDGTEVQMEAYTINGNNYVKLRDIGEKVGFNVYWDSANHCVQVESGKPYTGEATGFQSGCCRRLPLCPQGGRCDPVQRWHGLHHQGCIPLG